MSEVYVITDTPGVVAAAVLGREVRGEISSLSVGTSPWTRVLASRREICDDAQVAARLVAISLHAVDFGSLGITGSIGEVPHPELTVRIVLYLPSQWKHVDTHGAASWATERGSVNVSKNIDMGCGVMNFIPF